MGRERTEGERRAADELAEGVRREAERFFAAFVEEVNRNPGAYRVVPEPLSEEDADALALRVVHRDRVEHPAEAEDSAPSEAETRAWEEARERGRTEGRMVRAWKPTPPR